MFLNKYCGSVSISVAWRASKPTVLGNKMGVYSLFSILGSNCNLIMLGGFIIRCPLYSCFGNTQNAQLLHRVGA